MPSLLAGSGSSTSDQAADAGREATQAALVALDGRPADLVLVYCSVRYELSELLDAVRATSGGAAAVVGATSTGQVAAGELVPAGEGVVVLALAGDRYRFGVASGGGADEAPYEVALEAAAGARSAAAARSEDDVARPHHAVLLLVGGLAVDAQAVLHGVHEVAGSAVPIVGGVASDDRRLSRTSVFHDDQVLDAGVVAVWISSPVALDVSVGHGWSPVSAPAVVTRSEGLVVHEIGGRPAGEVWAEHALAAGPGSYTRQDGEVWQATYALGVIEPDGSHVVRAVYTREDQTLGTFTELPEYAVVQVLTADVPAVLSVVDPVVRAARGQLDDPTVVLTFDCVGRADILGEHLASEISGIRDCAGDSLVFGHYGYGEFARSGGTEGVHNATLCALGL